MNAYSGGIKKVFGKTEDLVIVLVIVLMLFGAKKLPELSKGISESVREVRSGFRDGPEPSQTVNTSQSDKKSESTTKA